MPTLKIDPVLHNEKEKKNKKNHLLTTTPLSLPHPHSYRIFLLVDFLV